MANKHDVARSLEFLDNLVLSDKHPKENVSPDHPFFRSLEALDFADGVEPGDGNKEAFVVKSGLVSFVAGLSKQKKKDALNSSLLAELASDKQHDRENDPINWYKFYAYVLKNIGWTMQEVNWDKFDTSGGEFSVDKVVLEVIAAIATGDEAAVVKATVDALKALDEGDGRLVLFETQSHSLQKGNFRIQLVVDSDGILVMKFGLFFFSTSDQVTKILFFTFSSASADFYKGDQAVDLDMDVFNQVRDSIVEKLGDKAKTFVKNLQI